MAGTPRIRTLFAGDIDRRIEEVIKVDQTDEEILREEIAEYVVTKAIDEHFTTVLNAYQAAHNHRTEGVGVWVSGFFGSGKSSFAKILGLAIENRPLGDKAAATRFIERVGATKAAALLAGIVDNSPTHAVIFDVSTDRGIRSGNQTITEIMYGLFLQSLGYAKDLDLSELEIGLEEKGTLAAFEAKYAELYGKPWAAGKGMVAFALQEASRVMHALEPETYASPGSWVDAARGRADVSPNRLADRATKLMAKRQPGKSLLFVIDEVGQFVARDVQKMLDLQGVVQALGRVGQGKHWVVVTSQEKLGELVSGLDSVQIELARLMDRFPAQVHLEPSDISEVTSRRVLAKNAAAQDVLGKLYEANQARLDTCTRLSADIQLPALSRQGFIDLYPLLPYQVDLIIQVVSGLRTQGGAGKHVGGANRTIIKLAQQVLINPSVNLADADVGALARLDQIYDLVEGSIASEVRAKIASIPATVKGALPLAEPVAKVICLLQFVKSVHRTAENIAACLHPAADADSQLAGVRAALDQLEKAQLVRLGDDGYRIPTPAEDDWERIRNGTNPTPGDQHRLHAEVLAAFWQPQPTYALLGARVFKAGLTVRGRSIVDGEITFHIELAQDPIEYPMLADDRRIRSQQERSTVHWCALLSDAIDHETVEVFRSREILNRKERDARTQVETALVAEEKIRLRRHQDELRRLLRQALFNGNLFFRGNDRPLAAGATEIPKAVLAVMDDAVPQIFDRFAEAGAKPADANKGRDALLTAANLNGLPTIFTALGLVKSENGKPTFVLDKGPLHEVLTRIEQRQLYGETVNGRWLAEAFAKEPFGWEFDTVRLLVLSLLRAGAIEVTHGAQAIDAATTPEAKEAFSDNNRFRAMTVRKQSAGGDETIFEDWLKANENSKTTFGIDLPELNAVSVASAIRAQVEKQIDHVSDVLSLLTMNDLPGAGVLEAGLTPMRAIGRGTVHQAIRTFNGAHASIKDAIHRTSELHHALTEPRLADIRRARRVLATAWVAIADESDLPEGMAERAAALADLLEREDFFREFPAIDQHAKAIEDEHAHRHASALADRAAAYEAALSALRQLDGWENLSAETRQAIEAPLASRTAVASQENVPISLLRADTDAAPGRRDQAIGKALVAIEGDRVVTLKVGPYFVGAIETAEQLDAALAGLRDECERLIGSGKKIVVQ